MRRAPSLSVSVICLLFCAVALSACGIRGDLKTPPPVWGEPTGDAPQPSDTSP